MSKQSKNARAAQSGLTLLPEEKIHVGCDVHAGKYAVALWSPQRGEWVCEWVQADDEQALLKRLEPLRPHVARVVYEAGPTGFGLARTLREAGLPCEVIAASHTPRAGVEPDKSDRRDARQLARFASQPGMLHPVYIPSRQEEQDRQVFRIREQHKLRLAQLKQRLKALLLCHGVAAPEGLKHWSLAGIAALRTMALPESLRWSVDELLLDLEEARAAVMRGNRKLQLMAKSEPYKGRVERLRTVPGVGLIVAMGFVLELMNLERFVDRRDLARFLGLCPKVGRSNEQVWNLGRPELGQETLRSLLVEAAWRWRRGDAYAATLFSRYLGNTGMKQKAIVALAHKLAVILWRIAGGELPYVPGLLRVPRVVAGLAPRNSDKAKTGRRAGKGAGPQGPPPAAPPGQNPAGGQPPPARARQPRSAADSTVAA
jgi:transposase